MLPAGLMEGILYPEERHTEVVTCTEEGGDNNAAENLLSPKSAPEFLSPHPFRKQIASLA